MDIFVVILQYIVGDGYSEEIRNIIDSQTHQTHTQNKSGRNVSIKTTTTNTTSANTSAIPSSTTTNSTTTTTTANYSSFPFVLFARNTLLQLHALELDLDLELTVDILL